MEGNVTTGRGLFSLTDAEFRNPGTLVQRLRDMRPNFLPLLSLTGPDEAPIRLRTVSAPPPGRTADERPPLPVRQAQDRRRRPRPASPPRTSPPVAVTVQAPRGPIVLTELLTSSAEFKASFEKEIKNAYLESQLRIQAYHFDDEGMVEAISEQRIADVWVILDKDTALKPNRTQAAIKKLKKENLQAVIKLIAGSPMRELYGPSSQIVGIHHAKTICYSGPRCTTLWIGSANFTKASEYNHEVMLKLQ